MKISIVTPSFRRIKYFEKTIDSILSQPDDFELEYIVQDGGGSEEIENLLARTVTRPLSKVKKFAYYIEEDDGMYGAINRAFSRASGDVLAWLNTDDMYHPNALSTVAKIFEKFPDIHWITGIPNSYNLDGARVGFDPFPKAYSKAFLGMGLYDVQHLNSGFNWIQQESTFWRRELWERAGPLNSKLKYAADFHLWKSFAKHTDLVRVNSFLGGFRVHGDQITGDPELYRSELPETTPPQGLEKLINRLKVDVKARDELLDYKQPAQNRLYNEFGLKRNDLCGRIIHWSHSNQEWELRWDLIL